MAKKKATTRKPAESWKVTVLEHNSRGIEVISDEYAVGKPDAENTAWDKARGFITEQLLAQDLGNCAQNYLLEEGVEYERRIREIEAALTLDQLVLIWIMVSGNSCTRRAKIESRQIMLTEERGRENTWTRCFNIAKEEA